MFAVAPLEVAPVRLSFKCTPENFAELCERPDIIPAPYMARAQWVALRSLNAVSNDELRELLAESYRLVWERLPKRRREELAGGWREVEDKAAGSKKKPRRTAKRRNQGRAAQMRQRRGSWLVAVWRIGAGACPVRAEKPAPPADDSVSSAKPPGPSPAVLEREFFAVVRNGNVAVYGVCADDGVKSVATRNTTLGPKSKAS